MKTPRAFPEYVKAANFWKWKSNTVTINSKKKLTAKIPNRYLCSNNNHSPSKTPGSCSFSTVFSLVPLNDTNKFLGVAVKKYFKNRTEQNIINDATATA